MNITYGAVADTAPEGFLPRRVHFQTLVRLNEPTKEGMLSRVVAGSGFAPRELPLDVKAQFATEPQHGGAILAGRLDAVKVEGNNVEGWAWIADDEAGMKTYAALSRQMLRGNSIDMADVKVAVDIEFTEDDDMKVTATFVESALAATTLVSTPAFAMGKAELEAELTASFEIEGDLEVTAAFEINVPERQNLTAAGGIVQPHDLFAMPEADVKTPITIDEHGRIFGHLGTWDSCHTGWVDRCVRIPRSRSNYANYCKSGVITDKGRAYTGPIFLLGGHEFTREAINKACGAVENAWGDVSVIDGKIGPWLSGVVRPGVSDEAIYAARASRISGHWLDSELYAICSVNAEGFEVPRARFETNSEGEVTYLMASFAVDCGCEDKELSIEDRLAAIEARFAPPPEPDPELVLLALAVEAALIEEDEDAEF